MYGVLGCKDFLNDIMSLVFLYVTILFTKGILNMNIRRFEIKNQAIKRKIFTFLLCAGLLVSMLSSNVAAMAGEMSAVGNAITDDNGRLMLWVTLLIVAAALVVVVIVIQRMGSGRKRK